jgi:hypothetical protein
MIAAGGFDTMTWQSTGIEYRAEVSSAAHGGSSPHRSRIEKHRAVVSA